MRWPQFVLTLTNLSFAIYLIVINVFLAQTVDSLTFLWTLIYFALALAISHLYMLYMSNKIDDWYDVASIKSISNLSVFSLLFCTLALAINIGLEYYYKRQFLATDKDSIMKIVPLVAALISSMILFTSSIKFKKYVLLCRSVDMTSTSQIPKRNYRTTDN